MSEDQSEMFDLVLQTRADARLVGVDAISVKGYIGLSDQCYSRVGEHVEFATSGINILAVKPAQNGCTGYKVHDNTHGVYYVNGAFPKRLVESIQRGFYVYYSQQGPWSIYKKTE
ncbi:MAG TPA: hypothetical protein PKJ47_13750 [Candidatus Limiplasma sp.]|nr:hypothetical protein [Candidatus Limiplasma sp.]